MPLIIGAVCLFRRLQAMRCPSAYAPSLRRASPSKGDIRDALNMIGSSGG